MNTPEVLLMVEPTYVRNLQEAEMCADYVRQLRTAQQEAECDGAEEVKFFHTEHKAAVAKQKAKTQPFEEAISRVRVLLLRWCEGNQPPSEVSCTPKWEVEITDPTIVPAEFCTPDLKLIEKFANSTSGATSIPGVKFNPKPTLTVRERKQ